jgi:hypothetical protein
MGSGAKDANAATKGDDGTAANNGEKNELTGSGTAKSLVPPECGSGIRGCCASVLRSGCCARGCAGVLRSGCCDWAALQRCKDTDATAMDGTADRSDKLTAGATAESLVSSDCGSECVPRSGCCARTQICGCGRIVAE